MSEKRVTVADVVAAIDAEYPFEWAEPWDAVGLRAGDPHAEVTGVLTALDPTYAAIERARHQGANVLVTHHPPVLEMPATLVPHGPGGVVFAAVSSGIALVTAHTNLDRGPDAASCLLRRLGLGDGEALERGTQAVRHVTVFCPPDAVDAVRDAMTAAGAGRVGRYLGCAFDAAGTGHFTPDDTARPAVGAPGEATHAPEHRLEMVCDASAERRVLDAVRAVHPYEEPLIAVADTAMDRGVARMGRSIQLAEAPTLAELADTVARTFDCTPRVWGSPDRAITTLATGTGSVRSLVGPAIAKGAQALLGGEVRYHDALDAVERGLAIIEAGHDVTEWPLVPFLADAVRSTPGLAPELVREDTPSRGWWTP